MGCKGNARPRAWKVRKGQGSPVLPRERFLLRGRGPGERKARPPLAGGGVEGDMKVKVDPALGRGVIVTIPAAAVRWEPRLFGEASRFADLVLLGREYGVAAGDLLAAWRAADRLAELRAELRRK